MNGLIPHHVMGVMEGNVIVDGLNTRDYPPRELAKKVAIVFDNPEYQLSQMTVMEEVALGLQNIGIPRDEVLRRVKEALELVGLSGLEKRSPFALSGGQQQRLAIAAGLAMYPDILVLDEPTSNLDPMGKDEVFEVVKELNKKRGMTVVMVENEIELLVEFADRLVIMNEGRVYCDGKPKEVFDKLEELLKIGLKPPQVTELACDLHNRGMPISRTILTVEEAYKEITKVIGSSEV